MENLEYIKGWRVTIANRQDRFVRTVLDDDGTYVDILADAIYSTVISAIGSPFLRLEVVARVAASFLQDECDGDLSCEFSEFIDAADKLVEAIDKWRKPR